MDDIKVLEQDARLAFEVLRQAVDSYFTARDRYWDALHDSECTDPLCDDREKRAGFQLASMSTFVVAVEHTAVDPTSPDATGTRTRSAFYGSPMAALGLLHEQINSMARA